MHGCCSDWLLVACSFQPTRAYLQNTSADRNDQSDKHINTDRIRDDRIVLVKQKRDQIVERKRRENRARKQQKRGGEIHADNRRVAGNRKQHEKDEHWNPIDERVDDEVRQPVDGRTHAHHKLFEMD